MLPSLHLEMYPGDDWDIDELLLNFGSDADACMPSLDDLMVDCILVPQQMWSNVK